MTKLFNQPDSMENEYQGSDEFFFVKSMFPNANDEVVLLALAEYNGSVEATMDYILSIDTIDTLQKESLSEPNLPESQAKRDQSKQKKKKKDPTNYPSKNGQKKPKDFLQVNANLRLDYSKLPEGLKNKLHSQFDQDGPVSTTWSELSQESSKLADLMRLLPSAAKTILHINNGDLIESVLSIIFRDETVNKVLIQSGKKQPTWAQAKEASDEEEKKLLSSLTKHEENYQKLSELLAMNPVEFNKISVQFWSSAFEYFNGDFEATLTLACVILADGAEQATYSRSERKKDSHKVEAVKSPISVTRPVKSSVNVRARGVEYFQESVVIDLHGFSLESAILETKMVLSDWWHAELKYREIHGRVKPGMKKVVGVKPLRIITGRGIHSAQGYSRIRSKIYKLLKSNEYIFHDDAGLFLIEGRRTNLI